MLVQKFIGIGFALLAMSLFSLAPVLQKSALDRLPPLSFSNFWTSLVSLVKNRRWMLGFAVGCLGLIPYVAALRLVGVAVVQPLYGFGFIVLLTVSRFMLHEKLHLAAKLAMGLLILMPVFIALGDVSGVQYDITQNSTQISLGVFMLLLLLAGGALFFFTKKHPLCWAAISGVLFGAGAVFAQMAISFLTLDELRNVNSFHALIRNEDLMFSLAAVLVAVPLNVFADYCMQVGLQKKTASRFMPMAQTVNNAVAVAGGIIIFGQRVTHWPFYIAGIVMGLAGLFLLAAFRHHSEKKSDFKDGVFAAQ
jgi:drug/metabolite transporter (DMT)-like permease